MFNKHKKTDPILIKKIRLNLCSFKNKEPVDGDLL